MKKSLLISSIASFALSVIGIIVFAINCEYLGASAVEREVHNSYAEVIGEMSAEAMNTLAIVSLAASIIFLLIGVFLLVLAIKKRGKAL